MKAKELLAEIRPSWLQRVSYSLTRGTNLRGVFIQQLERFFDGLEQAVTTGNPAWLDSILYEWTGSPTLTDLQQQKNNVADLLNKIISITNDVAIENLSEQDALDLLTTITPIYTYALEKTARLEMEARVLYISNELIEMQQKLERLDRSKSNFISVAAHELKTPLTLIEGYAAMMRDLVTQNGSGQIDTLLSGVNTGIWRLRQIIDDMIDVSLIDNHLLSLNMQPLWLSHLFDLLKRDLNDILRERQQILDVRAFPGSELWIYADSERLYQALYNVLTNAIKYTPDKGRISIDGRTLPGFIEVIVTDTGIGISPENQAAIFEKFGQLGRANLHSSGKTKFKGGGPGLGLPITRGIIEAHGGTIWVESDGCDEEKCPGSTFHILIPARSEPTDPKVAKLFGKLEKAKPEPDGQENPPADTSAA
ncbi:MAG: HAMP domain-containing histidine kinase [Chloroflexi bacterium]|nr:HAMP domain-containing histidine kinase [Chloroflexota bacterium]MBI3339694.1 HAMP domain-containing histidine kinase [Chloroflexota bacterium]